jgi:hypothetical protein
MDVFNIFHLLYWGGLAVIIVIEAATFGILWERKEAYRWTMGYFTVFFLGIPLIILGVWDATTWIGLFFAVGVGAMGKLGVEQWRKSREAQKLRQQRGGLIHGWSPPWKRG